MKIELFPRKLTYLCFSCALLMVLTACNNDNPSSLDSSSDSNGKPYYLMNLNSQITYNFFAYRAFGESVVNIPDVGDPFENIVGPIDNVYAYVDEAANAVVFNNQGMNSGLGGSYHHFGLSMPTGPGNSCTWQVTGGSAAIYDGVQAPSTDIHIVSPAFRSTVSKQTGLTVTWMPAGQGETVTVTVSPDKTASGHSPFEITTDSGSFTIPADELNTMNTGSIKVILRRGHYKIASAADGKNYFMGAWTQHERSMTLTD